MEKKLTRTTGSEAMILGVCGGLAKYFEIDATVIRVSVALLTIFTAFSLILIYIVMAFVVPKADNPA